MPLVWPNLMNVGGDLAEAERTPLKESLDRLADEVVLRLNQLGLSRHLSPLFQPWHLFVARDQAQLHFAFAPNTGGVSEAYWLDQRRALLAPDALSQWVLDNYGRAITYAGSIPLVLAEGMLRDAAIGNLAAEHVATVERSQVLARLGDLNGLAHLEPQFREFLEAHPDPDRNVFVMMRFLDSPQLEEAYHAIKQSLSERGLHAVRADDRDYTGELWSNIEVYLTCCNLGIALFEDIERRDFNPNVSLELGYMLGRRKRCLILKEQRLPDLPADVVHRLYKPWDAFNISQSVTREVGRWIDVDLGIRSI